MIWGLSSTTNIKTNLISVVFSPGNHPASTLWRSWFAAYLDWKCSDLRYWLLRVEDIFISKAWPDLFQWKYLGRGTGRDFLATDTGDFPRLSFAASLQSRESEYLAGLRAGWTAFKVTMVPCCSFIRYHNNRERERERDILTTTLHLTPLTFLVPTLQLDWQILSIYVLITEKSQGINEDVNVDINQTGPC